MKRPPNIPTGEGVFVVLHVAAKVAYVGKAKNLRQRASMWAWNLKQLEQGTAKITRVRGLPRYPADQWEFKFSQTRTEAEVRTGVEQLGVTIVNSKARTRKRYVVQGIDGTLNEHAKRLGQSAPAVYKRVERGMTPEQALGLAEAETFDARDQQIMMMRVKIVTDTGGWVTYDEALQMRPELGDIRTKVARWRKQHPDATEVKLSELT